MGSDDFQLYSACLGIKWHLVSIDFPFWYFAIVFVIDRLGEAIVEFETEWTLLFVFICSFLFTFHFQEVRSSVTGWIPNRRKIANYLVRGENCMLRFFRRFD